MYSPQVIPAAIEMVNQRGLVDDGFIVKFMNDDKKTRSSTSITLVIKDEWFKKFNEDEQKDVIKKVVSKLDSEGVAKDINGYPKAPPSLRLWGGATVQNNDMKALLPWIDWAYNSVKKNA